MGKNQLEYQRQTKVSVSVQSSMDTWKVLQTLQYITICISISSLQSVAGLSCWTGNNTCSTHLCRLLWQPISKLLLYKSGWFDSMMQHVMTISLCEKSTEQKIRFETLSPAMWKCCIYCCDRHSLCWSQQCIKYIPYLGVFNSGIFFCYILFLWVIVYRFLSTKQWA